MAEVVADSAKRELFLSCSVFLPDFYSSMGGFRVHLRENDRMKCDGFRNPDIWYVSKKKSKNSDFEI